MGKKMDSKLLSKQPHEIKYVRELARKYIEPAFTAGKTIVTVRASSLKRICKYILGKR